MGFRGMRTAALLAALAFCLALFAAPATRAGEGVPRAVKPAAGEVVFDAVVLRPMGVLATLLGGGLYLLSLPFSAAAENHGEVFDVLVEEPMRYTFERPLGQLERDR